MAQQLVELCQSYPQIVVFLSLGSGYLIGKVKFRGFGLGATTSVLLVALVLGQTGAQVPALLKTVSFALFIFAIGYKVGPQFFGALERGGLEYLWMSLSVAGLGLVTALGAGKLFGFDPGTVAGLLAGGLTTSSAIGTAQGAIHALSGSGDYQQTLAANMAIAYAITYVFGTGGTILFLKLYPRLAGIDMKGEAKKLEATLGLGEGQKSPSGFSWGGQIALRSYRVASPEVVGLRVGDLEHRLGAKVMVERLHRGERVFEPPLEETIASQDVLTLSGHSSSFTALADRLGPEVDDPLARNVVGEVMEICVLSRDVIGRKLGELAALPESRGIYLRRLTRQGHEVPTAPETVVHRCDLVQVIGAREDVERVIARVGYPERPTQATDLVMVGFGCVLGTLLGLLSFQVGGVPITLGVAGGVLVAGLLAGWLRSLHPTFGQIPSGGLWIMTDLGLNLFIACVGLGAGPTAVHALRSHGLAIFTAGVLVSVIPALGALLLGQFVLRMNPVLLLGAVAGARNITAALISLQEDAESSTPALGYAAPFAFANVLLTVLGSLVVNLSA